MTQQQKNLREDRIKQIATNNLCTIEDFKSKYKSIKIWQIC